MADQITLRIDGTDYRGWKSAAVRRSMQRPADTFELTLTERWADGAAPRPITPGLACEVHLGEERVISGYVDDAMPQYDAKNHTIVVNGRSRAGDLVDCSIEARQWKQRTLLQIARELAEPFGVSVSADVDVGDAFRQQSIQPGQGIHEFLDQLARIRGVLLVSEPNGDLLITRAGQKRIRTPLVLGENIRSAAGQFSARDLFSTYKVQSQQAGTDNAWGSDAAEPEASVSDDRLGRYRPVLVETEQSADIAGCRQRAKWERNVRFGRGRSVVYTVQGWRHDGGLWQANRLVPVRDRYLGIDADRLITGVQLILDDKGRRSEIEVMPPAAMDTIELPEPEEAGGWGS